MASSTSVEDAVYWSSLLVCLSLGSHYRRRRQPAAHAGSHYGAGVGMLLACVLCGRQVFHSALMVWGNVLIIKCCGKRYVHQISLAYTWMYLLYLHYHLTSSIYVKWLHQTMALRLTGLAFEVFKSDSRSASKVLESKSSTKIAAPEVTDNSVMEPSAVDIISYAYYFIGLHKGPYYRWKIFNEHFSAPFGKLGDCTIITEQKIKKALLCTFGYVLLRFKYKVDIYYDASFYEEYGTDFRFLYNVPLLVMYFLQQQAVTALCGAVCSESGFGVYPARCLPLPGYGPSTNFDLLKLASTSPEVALELEYNFAMLKCFEYEKLMLGPRMRDTMRAWDMPTRYWFWSNMYKSFLKSNKEVRSAVSFLAWTVWCGPSTQQIIVSITLWFYVHLEAEYANLYNTTGSMKIPWDIGYSIMRLFCLIYLTPCLTIEDAAVVVTYYNSIYWIYHVVMLGLMAAAVLIYKTRTD